MLVQVIIFVAFAMGLGSVAWWSWSQRQLARRQVEMQRDLAQLGTEVQDVAHDLQNLLASISLNVLVAKDLPANERAEALDDVEQATWSASRMVAALRSQLPMDKGMTCRTLVKLHAALLGRLGVEIEIHARGDLEHDGSDLPAERVVQNLLGNAVRESMRHPDAIVRVDLDTDRLVVSNPIGDDAELGDEIWEREVSGAHSSGLGLSIVRSSAESIGWTVRHEIEGYVVHFIVERNASARTSGIGITA